MFPESGFDKLDAGNLGKKYEGNSDLVISME